jgi:hypothetical protein
MVKDIKEVLTVNKYTTMANRIFRYSLLRSLTKEEREEAIDTANVFHLVSAFLEGVVPSQIPLEVLIKAEKTYSRLIGDI